MVLQLLFLEKTLPDRSATARDLEDWRNKPSVQRNRTLPVPVLIGPAVATHGADKDAIFFRRLRVGLTGFWSMRVGPRGVKEPVTPARFAPAESRTKKELPRRTFKTGGICFNLGAVELAVSILICASHEGDTAARSTAINNRFFHGHHAILIGIP